MKNINPLFLRFINKEVSATDLLHIYSKSPDSFTAETARVMVGNPPDLEEFRVELFDAVGDAVKTGIGEEFRSFVNHYMEPSLIEDMESSDGTHGENSTRQARLKDASAPWVQGFLCYNLCLYIKAFGFDELKKCKVCGKLFDHKGQYAVYCSEGCKSSSKKKDTNGQNQPPKQT
jgi:hypothetical protein